MTDENKCVAPEHLNEQVFKRCLGKVLNTQDFKIVNYKISAGSNPGDNYTSTIYRAEVMYKKPTSDEKKIQLLIKSIVIDEPRAFLEKLGIVDKEIHVYLELLPRLNEILEPIAVAPKLYDVFTEPHRNLVFQDMKELGFTVADRELGLDEDHLAVVLHKIAQFHAGSIKLLENSPDIEKRFPHGFFNEVSLQEFVFREAFKENVKHGAKILAETSGFERFSKKMMKLYENFEEITLGIFSLQNENDFKVLVHGDLWVNNFLFKYDEKHNKPIDTIFIDYQGTFVGNLAIDLHYLFASSSALSVLERRNEFVEKYYYPTFVNSLKKLNIRKIPPLSDIMSQIETRGIFYIVTLFGILPLVSMDREESKTNDITQFMDEEVSQQKRAVGMSSRRFRETLKYAMLNFEKNIDEAISKY